MDGPDAVPPVMLPGVSQFLLQLSRIRDANHILASLLDTALEATSSPVGVAGARGQAAFEIRRGEFDDELRRYEKEWYATLESAGDSAVTIACSTSGGMAAWGSALRAGDRLIYTMVAKESAFESWQQQVLILLLQGAAAGIANAEEWRTVSRKLEQLDLVHNIGRAMNSVLDIRELLDEIMEMGRLTMKAAACSVMLVDEQRRELVFEVAQGEAGTALQQFRMPMDAGIAGWIATHGEPIIIRDVTKDTRHYRQADQVSGFSTHSIIGAPLLAQGKVIGVIEVLNRLDGSSFDENDLELLTTIASDAAVAVENARLYRAVHAGYVDTIQALAAAVDAKDPYTHGHSERVTQYSLLTAEALALAKVDRETLRRAAVLHDVGKIGIDEHILRKPVPLDAGEWQVMCTHAAKGAHIVDNIEFLAEAKPAIRGHHERLDGKGYPDGLRGEEIPLGARIIAVADSFDAMTTDRPYRKALGIDFALSELKSDSGTQFDPELAAAFIEAFEAKDKPGG